MGYACVSCFIAGYKSVPETMQGQHVLLGVCGGIAAYKSAELARLLIKAGAQVQVVMTRAAGEFIAPLTLQAITGQVVRSDLFSHEHEAGMGHIELARWADQVVIAPATAGFMARLAHGMAADLLDTLCLATPAPVFVAPAMNEKMWRNSATRDNAEILRRRSIQLLGPGEGEQACGDNGLGRMIEPTEIVAALSAWIQPGALAGRKVMVTAGPTREALDPVRYLSNRSSGKMGFQLARAFQQAGAEVQLVSGPVMLDTPFGVKRVNVESARQMRDAVFADIHEMDIFAACAAVADYRPQQIAAEKIKKTDNVMTVKMVKNPDILAQVAAMPDGPFTLGFAAETANLEAHARAKLERKGVDLLAANSVAGGRGFDVDENALLVLWRQGEQRLQLQSKAQLARKLVSLTIQRYMQQMPR